MDKVGLTARTAADHDDVKLHAWALLPLYYYIQPTTYNNKLHYESD